MAVKITQRTVDAVKTNPDRDVWLWDNQDVGFGVRCTKGGVVSFVAQYRVGRRTRRTAIGRHPTMKVEAARLEAVKIINNARIHGIDASAAKKEARRKGQTVAEYWRDLIDGPVKKLAKGTHANWESNFKNWIGPTIGKLLMRDVTTSDIKSVQREMAKPDIVKKKVVTPSDKKKITKPKKVEAIPRQTHWNRVRSQLHRGFALAEFGDTAVRPRGSNPVTAEVPKYKEKRRQRFLNADELRRLNDALTEMETDPVTGLRDAKQIMARCVAAVRLLITTGLRHREALHLQWPAIDWQRRVLHLDNSKTGQRDMPLNSTALAILKDMHAHRVPTSLHVFAGAKAKKPVWSLKNIWPSICRRAGLEGVRIHDLRHSFASLAVGQGESLFLTGKLLGHATTAMTGRYAHLADDPIRAASEKIGHQLAAIWAPNKIDAEVVTLSSAKLKEQA